MGMVLVVGEVGGAETERGKLNDSLRGGEGGPSKMVRGALSCNSGLIVWSNR